MLSATGLFLFLKLPFFGYEGATIGHNELSGLWAGQSVESGVPTSCLPREQTFRLRSPSYLTELCPGGEELRGLVVHPILQSCWNLQWRELPCGTKEAVGTQLSAGPLSSELYLLPHSQPSVEGR